MGLFFTDGARRALKKYPLCGEFTPIHQYFLALFSLQPVFSGNYSRFLGFIVDHPSAKISPFGLIFGNIIYFQGIFREFLDIFSNY